MNEFSTDVQREKYKYEYNKDAAEASGNDFVVARLVEDVDGDKTSKTHYVAVYNGILYDPRGTDANRLNQVKSDVKYRQVSEKVFKSYMQYLQDKKLANYNHANRSYLNG